IRTDLFVNEHNQVVQMTRAASIAGVAAANPADPLYNNPDPNVRLTAFAYLSRASYDYNGNVVVTQVEDRGNTSHADPTDPATLPAAALATTPGLSANDGPAPPGGPAFVDTLNLYDRINDPIETRTEVDNTHALTTRYRYDANQNRVLTIYPEGNAAAAVYDE